MSWLVVWLPFVLAEILLLLILFIWAKKSESLGKFLKFFLAISLVIAALLNGRRAFLMYLAVSQSDSPLKSYLLTNESGFLQNQFLSALRIFLISILISVVLMIVLRILKKYQKRELIDSALPMVVFIAVMLSGIFNLLVLVIFSVFLAILFQLFLFLRFRNLENRLSLIPFILISAVVINVLSLFPFYQSILNLLHLI